MWLLIALIVSTIEGKSSPNPAVNGRQSGPPLTAPLGIDAGK